MLMMLRFNEKAPVVAAVGACARHTPLVVGRMPSFMAECKQMQRAVSGTVLRLHQPAFNITGLLVKAVSRLE